MPKIDSEYIPEELLQIKTVMPGIPGDRYVQTTTKVEVSTLLTLSEKQVWIARAVSFTQNMRLLLNLGEQEKLEHVYPMNYHELDAHGNEIVQNGALIFVPVIRDANGGLRREQADIVWVDDDHRPEPLTKDNIAFGGQIAMQLDERGGGWYGQRLSEQATHSLRDDMLAREAARLATQQYQSSPTNAAA